MAAKKAAQKAKKPARKARRPASKAQPPPESSVGDPTALPDALDHDQLEAWLREKPREVSVAIAARAALRVLPLIAREFEIQEQGSEIIDEIVSRVFRSVALAWAAAKYPERSSGLDVFAARAAASSPADTASVMSNLAARAVYARHNLAARFATRAADSITYEFDIRQIADGVSGEDLAGLPLWPDGAPPDIRLQRQELWDLLYSLNQDWEVWTDWYEARLEGRPSNEALEAARATIDEDIWQQGPAAVNAHIRALIDNPPPLAETGGTDKPSRAAPQPRPNVWLAQFKQGDRVSQWVRDAGPGSQIPWKIGNVDITDMKGTDRVVYWRTVTKGRDRGGIVGTGLVTSPDPVAVDDGVLRILTEVSEFFDDQPLGRDDVLAQTGLAPNVWNFSLYQLPADVAEKMDAILRANNREPLFADIIGQPFAGAGEIVFVGDAPERDEDFLGRVDLAFMVVARLNRIWDEMNDPAAADPAGGEQQADGDTGQGRGYDAGFVVHIDAPWGGGKTSFANYLMRIFIPYCLPPPLPKVLQALPLDDPNYWPVRFRRPWHIVTFNAWQHQHVDPPWWCFYQATRRQCFHATRTEAWDLSDKRLSPPNAGWPGFWELRQARWLGHWARELLWRLFHPKIRTLLLIAVPTLVIAALAIRFGLFSFDATKQKWVWSFDSWPPLLLGGASLLLGGASAIWAFVSVITESLFPGTPVAAKNYSLGAGDPLERFRTHFARTINRLKRPVLVVVDDIDRCEPKFVVELIRGMQTILRSPRVIFLLLGDRDWIEHSFAETHNAMKGINVGPEHSFGGRFVEKAIQLSIVLPDIPPDERSAFVNKLLGVDSGEADPVRQLADEQRQQVEQSLQSLDLTADPVVRDKSAADMRARVFNFEAVSDEVKERVAKTIDRRVALRSAADEKVSIATQHRIAPIAGVLPPNPRQIKRIINAIALFQEIARIRMEVQPDTTRWRQLALWIVLMTEWPQTWTTLATWPDLIVRVHNPTATIAIDGLDMKAADHWVEAIRANPEVMALLDFPSSNDVPDTWKDSKIDAEAVRALTVILPPTSGEPLPKPERQAETAANGG